MKNLIKVKTADLTGAALDWSVAIAIGFSSDGCSGNTMRRWTGAAKETLETVRLFGDADILGTLFSPSTDWAQGGPLLAELMDSSQYAITPFCNGGFAISNTDNEGFPYSGNTKEGCFEVIGDDLLTVTCRAVVARKLGDEVDVPAELVGVRHEVPQGLRGRSD